MDMKTHRLGKRKRDKKIVSQILRPVGIEDEY